MGIYKRGDTWTVRVPTRSGRVARTTGTGNRALARRIDGMLEALGPRGSRDWQLLDAVVDSRLMVAELYDAYVSNSLDDLRARLQDVDLTDHLDAWIASVRGRLADSAGTASRYLLHVRTAMPEGAPFLRSALTLKFIEDWLAGLPCGPATRRKHHAAMSSFCEYLRRAEILARNPLRDVQAPPQSAPRSTYLEQDQVLSLIEAQAEPFRTIEALLHGTGIEISVALRLKRGDVDSARHTIRAAGTKTHARDRVAYVAEWAWPYIERHIALLHPGALLFPKTDRWRVSDAHRAACAALGIKDYRLHDARHTYAVRAIRAGAPFEVVAQQLGHSNTNMVTKVYGRFKPKEEEFREWERIANAQDAMRFVSRS
jgi:integrase